MSEITVTMPIKEYERMKEEIEDLKQRNRRLQRESIYTFIELDHSGGGEYPNVGICEGKIQEYVTRGYYTPDQKSGLTDEKEETTEG